MSPLPIPIGKSAHRSHTLSMVSRDENMENDHSRDDDRDTDEILESGSLGDASIQRLEKEREKAMTTTPVKGKKGLSNQAPQAINNAAVPQQPPQVSSMYSPRITSALTASGKKKTFSKGAATSTMTALNPIAASAMQSPTRLNFSVAAVQSGSATASTVPAPGPLNVDAMAMNTSHGSSTQSDRERERERQQTGKVSFTSSPSLPRSPSRTSTRSVESSATTSPTRMTRTPRARTGSNTGVPVGNAVTFSTPHPTASTALTTSSKNTPFTAMKTALLGATPIGLTPSAVRKLRHSAGRGGSRESIVDGTPYHNRNIHPHPTVSSPYTANGVYVTSAPMGANEMQIQGILYFLSSLGLTVGQSLTNSWFGNTRNNTNNYPLGSRLSSTSVVDTASVTLNQVLESNVVQQVLHTALSLPLSFTGSTTRPGAAPTPSLSSEEMKSVLEKKNELLQELSQTFVLLGQAEDNLHSAYNRLSSMYNDVTSKDLEIECLSLQCKALETELQVLAKEKAEDRAILSDLQEQVQLVGEKNALLEERNAFLEEQTNMLEYEKTRLLEEQTLLQSVYEEQMTSWRDEQDRMRQEVSECFTVAESKLSVIEKEREKLIAEYEVERELRESERLRDKERGKKRGRERKKKERNI